MISDAECIARGGHIETEQSHRHLERRGRHDDMPRVKYRICRIPSPKNGAACANDSECDGGRCRCTGVLSGPEPTRRDPELEKLDGTPIAGECSDEGFQSGYWYCLLRDGKANINGIIVD